MIQLQVKISSMPAKLCSRPRAILRVARKGLTIPLLPEPMSDASGGEPEDALIPESEPTQPADEETFFETDPASTRSAATETETEVDPSDSSSAAGAEATAAAEDALNQGGEMGDSYEDEPLTAGQQAALEAAADAVAAAGEALLRAAEEMSDSEQGFGFNRKWRTARFGVNE